MDDPHRFISGGPDRSIGVFMADKALILGINDYKSVNSLNGCINDVHTMRSLLIDVFKFPEKNVKTLTNDQVVKSDVLEQLDWLFQGTKAGDRVVLHFSGHGSYVDDKDGDEPDGRDELIALYDMDFSDPDTYLLDDELRDWTKKKPKGVELTVVLDNCNSGTGTRMFLAPQPDGVERQILVDQDTTLKRSLSSMSVLRGQDAAKAATRALQADNADLVLVRYLEPPQNVKNRVSKARAKMASSRGFVKVKELNHVLLAACEDGQTAADATIDGKPCGAFTYFLNQTIRTSGANIRRQDLIDKVAASLQQGHFSQIPQLEGETSNGPLFSANDDVSDDAPSDPGRFSPVRDIPSSSDAVFLAMLDKLYPLDIESRKHVLDIYDRHFGSAATGRLLQAPSLTGQRFLVNVHGICKHVAGYSDPWWDALHPFTNEFGSGARGQSRREVLWSDLVNERALQPKAISSEQADLKELIVSTLQDRADRHVLDSGAQSDGGEPSRGLDETRGLISIPGLNCIDDFLVYMTDDNVRAAILARFTDVVRPLLQSGAEIDVVSHSWGTVVAYEGLRELADKDGLTSPLIRNFFTVGAALSISPVKFRLRPANKDGRRPAMVRRWVNLNANGDPVGGPLKGRPYAVDFDFPNLDAFGCAKILGFVNPSCAHGSYFTSGNLATNRDIFARFMNTR